MELTRQIDIYCERTDLSFWSEPVNAVSNLAFLIAALVMWRRTRGENLPVATALVAFLALTGVGSTLWHTFAAVWSVMLDVLGIFLFSITYVFAANRDFWRLPLWTAIGATALFFPYAAAVSWAVEFVPFLRISGSYWSLALLIALYAAALARRAPATSRGLALGAGILVVSLVFRSLDETICENISIGTHFMWHLLNGVMLGWMIEVYRRHMVASRAGAV